MTKEKKSQLTLKLLLGLQTIGILIYTIIVLKASGFIVFEKAFEFISSMAWRGQFTLDFGCYLLLSAIWIIWRNKGSISSIIIGLTASILGIIVFAPYLLYLLQLEKGDLKKVLIANR